MSKSKKMVPLLFLALGQGAVYFLPYIRNVYYTPLLETLKVSNAQFGGLVSYFAIGCMILYIPGGIMSDKLNYKKCITISLFSTAILVASFAFFMNYTYAKVIFFLMAFTTTFVFWSSALKAVRIIGESDEQGKTFGIYYAIQGLLSIIIQNVLLYVFNRFSDQAIGLKVVLLGNALVNLMAGIGCQVFLNEYEEQEITNKENSFQFSKIGLVIKNPLVWCIALMVLCAYGLYSNSYYYTTFLTTVKGLDPNIGAQLSLIRVTYMMCAASFIGGFAADKLKSTTKWYAICATGATITAFLFFALMKSNINVMVLGILSILPSAFMLLVYGVTSSLYEEYRIPVEYTGTAIGIVSIIGYTPDLFFGPMLGSWLDKSDTTGFTSIFIFFAIIGIIGLVSTFVAKSINTKQTKIQQNTIIK